MTFPKDNLVKAVVLLTDAEIKQRPQYGDGNLGVKLTFKDVVTFETYWRTVPLVTKHGPTLIRYFMDVILDAHRNYDYLLENHDDLIQAFKDNDDKFFKVDIQVASKQMKNGKPFKNIKGIQEYKPTFEEKRSYFEKGIGEIEL